MSKATNRCPNKNKERKNQKPHENKFTSALEKKEYIEMARYIEKNPFTDSDNFKDAFYQINAYTEPNRQEYNKMKAWYELSQQKDTSNSIDKYF